MANFQHTSTPTGVGGLDTILRGGLPAGHVYLLSGKPGTGKTTLGLQFLIEGARRGEPCLLFSLSNTRRELELILDSHGWSLDGITVCDLGDSPESLQADWQYSVFHPTDVELNDTTQRILDAVERALPRRVLFDSLAEMRLLARDPIRFRRQVWALRDYLSERECTTLLLDYGFEAESENQIYSITNGVIRLEQRSPEYGAFRRRLLVEKMRGVAFDEGYHDFRIRYGGIDVYPRLPRPERHPLLERQQLPSGLPELDELFHGGFYRGASALIIGPDGVGKSALASQYAVAAAQRGETAAVFLLDESEDMFINRSEGLGMDVRRYIREGRLILQGVDPVTITPGEFGQHVRAAVEERDASVVVLDDVNGYDLVMGEACCIELHLQEILGYLRGLGTSTLLVLGQQGIIGETVASRLAFSYLCDNMLLLRHFEVHGAVHKALSVIKRRGGAHEATIRELLLSSQGLALGPLLRDFQGVLSGRLEFTGDPTQLARQEREPVASE